MTTEKRTNIDKCVGIKDNTLYILNSVFKHSEDFKGATGSMLSPITQEYIDSMNSLDYAKDNYDYLWRESVASNITEKSLDEYIEDLIAETRCNTDSEYVGHDTSDIHLVPEDIKEKYFPEAATFKCIGGGRCFDHDMEFDIVLDQGLLDLINKYETKNEVQA